MRRIGGLGVPAEVLENPLDHCRILDAGDDPQSPAAAPAELDLDGEHYGPQSGAFGRELDLIAAGRWLDAFDDEKCASGVRARAESTVLALVQAFGRCDILYVPQPEGAYAPCRYCADRNGISRQR